MRVGEQLPQQKSIEIYAQQLGRTPRTPNHIPILHNSNVEGQRDEKPPFTFPGQRPRGVRKVARMQQMQQMQQFPGFSSRQNSNYRPQPVAQRQREAQNSQAQYPSAGPSGMEYSPSTQQRFGPYQRVPQQQAQSGIYSSLGAPRTITEQVNGVGVTRVVDESPFELVNMPQAQQQLAHFCSSTRPQDCPPEVARLPEIKGPAPGQFLETAESGARAFEAATIPPHLPVEWDPLREYYSIVGSGDSMISGEEDETMAGSGEVVEMAGLNSYNGIA